MPIPQVGCIMINVDAVSDLRCPCRNRPDDPHEREDMQADLAVVWWVIAHGRIRPAHYCYQCAPTAVFASIDCVHCGDGPLVVLASPTLPAGADALLRIGLASSGWIAAPAGEWVCADCQTGR